MIEHRCAPPIGPASPDTWMCFDCGQAWRRDQRGDIAGWRWPGEERTIVVCPHCRNLGAWAWPPDEDEDLAGNLFTPPKGHVLTELAGVPWDECPVQNPTSRLYDPRPPWTSEDA